MSSARTYKLGKTYRVLLDGHNETVSLPSIEIDGMCAGGGVMLIADRGDGEIDRIIKLLNDAESRTVPSAPYQP